MFNKNALSLAVAAAATGLSVSSMAAINLDTGTGKVAIAEESVAVTSSGIFNVGAGTNGVLDLNVALGIGVAADDQVFVRIDWDTATLNDDFAATQLSIAGTAGSSVSNGLTGDDNAIFGVQTTVGFSQTAAVILTAGTNGISASSSVDIRFRVYEAQADAVNELAPLVDKTLTGAVTLDNAVGTSFVPATATAEVTTDFTQFEGGSLVGQLGQFTTSLVNTGLTIAATGVAVTSISQVIQETGSVVTINGDFAFGTWAVGNTNGSCTSGTTSIQAGVDTVGFATATTTVDVANGLPLCVTVDGMETIPEFDYSADISFVNDVTNSAFPTPDASGPLGSIVRNGTTVEVAYITTFDSYNQRLLINSRNTVASQYSISFQAEAGVTVTPLAAASGTLQPGENLVLRADEIVDIQGSSRCSATVTVVAPEDRISVATTQVNLADRKSVV